MAKIKKLNVTVTYQVGLGGVSVPKKILEQLEQAAYDFVELGSNTIDSPKYSEATRWLMDNIKERDCMYWECEINQI